MLSAHLVCQSGSFLFRVFPGSRDWANQFFDMHFAWISGGLPAIWGTFNLSVWHFFTKMFFYEKNSLHPEKAGI